MGAFDSVTDYNSNPYNGQQRMESVVWLVITAMTGCIFIVKRIYFKNLKKDILKYDNIEFDITDIMMCTILFVIATRVFFGPPYRALITFIIFIFTIGLVIAIINLLQSLWKKYLRIKRKSETDIEWM